MGMCAGGRARGGDTVTAAVAGGAGGALVVSRSRPPEVGGAMDDTRLELIRRKNAAFAALTVALAACERRRHVAGTVPAAWLERLDDLRTAYARAVVAWERGRSRWTG